MGFGRFTRTPLFKKPKFARKRNSGQSSRKTVNQTRRLGLPCKRRHRLKQKKYRAKHHKSMLLLWARARTPEKLLRGGVARQRRRRGGGYRPRVKDLIKRYRYRRIRCGSSDQKNPLTIDHI